MQENKNTKGVNLTMRVKPGASESTGKPEVPSTRPGAAVTGVKNIVDSGN